MKEYQDFTGTIIKKSRSIIFGCQFTLQNDTDTIRIYVGKGIYDTYSEGTQLQIGHIGKKLINISPAEELSQDAVLWNPDMKSELKYDGWTFIYDKDCTTKYYASHKDTCDCAYCRNFRLNSDKMPSKARAFLEEFGIDIGNPVEQMSMLADKDSHTAEQEVIYFVSGTAESLDGYEIDIDNIQIVVNHFTKPNCEMAEPCFTLTLYNMYFPWTVDEDIDKAYPEPKNHIAVKRIYPDLFFRLKKHYCPFCKTSRLYSVRTEKIVDSKSAEAQEYDFSNADSFFTGKVKFVLTEYKCPDCNRQFTENEVRKQSK